MPRTMSAGANGGCGTRRVVITGIGLHCALGDSLQATWPRLIAGQSGIRTIPFWDASECNVAVGAPVQSISRETGVDSIPWNYIRRGARIFLQTVREAFQDAGLAGFPISPRRIGLAAGASVNYVDHRLIPGYFDAAEDRLTVNAGQLNGNGGGPSSFFRRQGDTVMAIATRVFRLGGPAFLIDTACAASAHAIGEAFRLVRHGTVDAMIAGGSAALINPIGILAFDLIGALSRNRNPEQASRPFDKQRDGFVMGEGGGAVVLESLESARRRGARIYAELAGFGNTLNAHNLTDPTPDGSGEGRAISLALQDAGLAPEDVDFVAAHGTSTLKNDAVETLAIKRAFGAHARRLQVSSNKGQLGHTISAAGVLNVASAALAISKQHVPPTVNLRNPDPVCDLDYIPDVGRKSNVRAAIANAFAFGGQNAVLALRTPP